MNTVGESREYVTFTDVTWETSVSFSCERRNNILDTLRTSFDLPIGYKGPKMQWEQRLYLANHMDKPRLASLLQNWKLAQILLMSSLPVSPFYQGDH